MIGRLLDLSRRDAKARAKELLEWFDLTEAADRPARTYSGGMRRRLDLAASLVGRPSVIFLDEPTTGLDPSKRGDMWGVVRSLVADGATVLLTTQYLEEADALADEITVVDHGRVIANDTPDGLKRIVGGQTLTVRPTDPDAARGRGWRSSPSVAGARPDVAAPRRAQRPGRRRRRAARGRRAASPSAGIALTELSLHLPSLDEAFLALTGTGEPRDRPRARARGGRMRLARHCATLAWRSLDPHAARRRSSCIDVTLQPVLFLVIFTYIFGGAIAAGSQHDYLQFLLPGLLGQSIALGGVAIGVNLSSRPREGRSSTASARCRSPARRRSSAP